MRHRGKLVTWKEDKGFGFIGPDAGGEQVFVHIKAFLNRKRRPAENEILAYDLRVDEKGRVRAENVAFAGDDSSKANSFGTGSVGIGAVLSGMAGVFVGLVALLVYMGRLPAWILQAYLAASAIAFIAYAIDKSAAKGGRRRTRESTLHLLGLAFGWPGALLAQRALRHKSRKLSFQLVFWFTVILNCVSLWCVFTSSGRELVRSVFTRI